MKNKPETPPIEFTWNGRECIVMHVYETMYLCREKNKLHGGLFGVQMREAHPEEYEQYEPATTLLDVMIACGLDELVADDVINEFEKLKQCEMCKGELPFCDHCDGLHEPIHPLAVDPRFNILQEDEPFTIVGITAYGKIAKVSFGTSRIPGVIEGMVSYDAAHEIYRDTLTIDQVIEFLEVNKCSADDIELFKSKMYQQGSHCQAYANPLKQKTMKHSQMIEVSATDYDVVRAKQDASFRCAHSAERIITGALMTGHPVTITQAFCDEVVNSENTAAKAWMVTVQMTVTVDIPDPDPDAKPSKFPFPKPQTCKP